MIEILNYIRPRISQMSEEIIGTNYPSDKLKTPVHLYIGQKAIITGVTHELKPEDQFFSTYRNHGIYLAK